MDTIGRRIFENRERLDLSMEQLAETIGVTWQTIQQWENGKTAPKRTRAAKVAKALGMSESALLLGLEETHTAPGVRKFTPRRSDDHPAIMQVVELMTKMNDSAKARLVERAMMLAEEFPASKPNLANSSQ